MAGRTLLLCAEQGTGDLIQFVRFTEQLADVGIIILIECAPNLKRLLASCPGVAQVVGVEQACQFADYQLPLMSVPRMLGTRLDDLPGRIPYLAAPHSDWSALDAVANAPCGFKVGVAWTGDPRNPKNSERSLRPCDFACLSSIPGVYLFSLQYKDAGESPDRLAQFGIRSLGDALSDFASAAAAIERFDLTITIDTSLAHLAGALGKPVWTLLDYLPDWRWMTAQSSSPWYPTMRLYRQHKAGNWTEALKCVERDLSEIAIAHATKLRGQFRKR